MDKGYVWFALNNSTTDYIELSKGLAKSIKKVNQHNKVCVITDKPVEDELFDFVKVLKQDESADQEWKLSNEYKVYSHRIPTGGGTIYGNMIRYFHTTAETTKTM